MAALTIATMPEIIAHSASGERAAPAADAEGAGAAAAGCPAAAESAEGYTGTGSLA